MLRLAPILLLAACKGGKDAGPDGTPPAPALAALTLPEVVEVGETVRLDATGSVGATFTWSFGDGDAEETTVSTADHTWEAPGHLTVSLTVTGPDGSLDTAQAGLTVVWPLADPAPTAASALVGSEDRIYAVMPDHDALAVIDRATRQLTRVDTCGHPRSVAAAAGTAVVACERDAVAWHAADGALTDTTPLPWGSRPFGVLYAGGNAEVTLQGTGAIARLSPGVVLTTSSIGPDLRGLAHTGEALLVSRHRSPDAQGETWSWNGVTSERSPLAPDPGPDSDTDARGVPTYLERIAVRPDGRVAVVGGLKANMDRGLVRDGLPLTHETAARSVLRAVSLHPDEGPVGSELAAEPHFDDRDRVSAMVFSPRGDWLWVAHHGARMVDLVDAYTLDRVGGFFVDAHGPDGLWTSEDGTELWVLASLSRELLVYDVSDPLAPPVELDRIALDDGVPEPLGDRVLRGKQIFYDASDPRMTEANYLSCGSCHLDGDQDGRTWDFTDRSEGLRNTITLLGGAGVGPLHWSANFDEVQDFENDIRGPMAGRGFLTEADWLATQDTLGPPKAGLSEELDALAAYVESLDTVPRSPYRDEDGTLTSEAQAGEALFLSPTVGCADCHIPPTYTDSQLLGPDDPLLHDVGTLLPTSGKRRGGPLVGIDTPSLRGLHATAPYLHDGRHTTVRDLLEDNPYDLHGVTSQLTPTELGQLEQFLLSLE